MDGLQWIWRHTAIWRVTMSYSCFLVNGGKIKIPPFSGGRGTKTGFRQNSRTKSASAKSSTADSEGV